MKLTLPIWLFFTLWFGTLLLPIAVFKWSAVLGASLGVMLPIAWLRWMPTGCINGAFIAFLMATIQFCGMLRWIPSLILLSLHARPN